jgi:hypothetical protein
MKFLIDAQLPKRLAYLSRLSYSAYVEQGIASPLMFQEPFGEDSNSNLLDFITPSPNVIA